MPLLFSSRKRKRNSPHPYLSGNFAPVQRTFPLTACSYAGTIPEELAGGEYVRNGGNPVSNADLGREAHFFDGDGMLSGIAFKRTDKGIQPEFVNQYILTDLYLSTTTSSFLRRPILPSIATLVDPLSTLLTIILEIFRSVVIVILSKLPGSLQSITRISAANTGILFHDGRALATCESGPPMRVSLPGLETVGWYNGRQAEGEHIGEQGSGFGGDGLLSFMKEWTTAHPRVDPLTEELVLFHSTFTAPYVYYSVIPATYKPKEPITPLDIPTRLLNAPIPGISSAKMMHDFGVSANHTVIMDLPLTLDPVNMMKNLPPLFYDPAGRSRFGVFPRYNPDQVRWFETKACCTFHTANTWDDTYIDKFTGATKTSAVNMLSCRMTTAALVFSAGDIAVPPPIRSTVPEEPEECHLYYQQFDMTSPRSQNKIKYQFSLADISFEFPSTREDASMKAARYIYGTSTTEGSFTAALGRGVKIDCLVKVDAQKLIAEGKKISTLKPVVGCVDRRSLGEILASKDPKDPIKIFRLPEKHFAQEPRFVPRRNGKSEDDGWLLAYVFDESQMDGKGTCLPDARSELWIIDATDMQSVVARVQLPMRVPYGLHGAFIEEKKILSQRPVETIRSLQVRDEKSNPTGIWGYVRGSVEKIVG